MILVGRMRKINQTQGAIIITVQGESLDGRDDRIEYLPKSKINIRKSKYGEFLIYVPDWLINRKAINWNRIEEIEPLNIKGVKQWTL